MFDKVNMTITCTTETRVSAYPPQRPSQPRPAGGHRRALDYPTKRQWGRSLKIQPLLWPPF